MMLKFELEVFLTLSGLVNFRLWQAKYKCSIDLLLNEHAQTHGFTMLHSRSMHKDLGINKDFLLSVVLKEGLKLGLTGEKVANETWR